MDLTTDIPFTQDFQFKFAIVDDENNILRYLASYYYEATPTNLYNIRGKKTTTISNEYMFISEKDEIRTAKWSRLIITLREYS